MKPYRIVDVTVHCYVLFLCLSNAVEAFRLQLQWRKAVRRPGHNGAWLRVVLWTGSHYGVHTMSWAQSGQITPLIVADVGRPLPSAHNGGESELWMAPGSGLRTLLYELKFSKGSRHSSQLTESLGNELFVFSHYFPRTQSEWPRLLLGLPIYVSCIPI